MGIAYLVTTILLAAIVTFSGVGKIRRDPHIVQIIHEVIGVPLQYFPLLAACEIAGAAGVVLGIWWPLLGVTSGICIRHTAQARSANERSDAESRFVRFD